MSFMKKQNKIYLGIGIVVIILIVAVAMFPAPKGEETIKIGISLPLTGGYAIIGEPMKAAIDLAIEDVNSNSDRYKYEAIYEDDQFNPTNSLSAVQKLVSIDNVDFLITAGSPVGMAIGPIAEEKKIVHFGIASSNIAGIGSYNFNHWTPPKKQAEKMAQEIKDLNINNIGLITFNQEGGMAIRNELVKSLDENNLNIKIEEKFAAGEKDFKTIWQKVENTNPEIIILIAMSPELEVVLKQRIELGYDTPLTAIESPKYSESPELFNGNWFIDAADVDVDFAKEFKQRTGKDIFAFSGNAYDIVKILDREMQKFDEKPNSEKIKEALLNMDAYTGVMGPMTIDVEGNLLTEAIKLKMVDGVPVKVE